MEPALVTIPLDEYQRLIAVAQEISKLRDEIEYLQEKFARDIAEDRRRITAIEHRQNAPEPRQINQAEVLHALLAANNGKMLQSTAREKMRLSAVEFSKLLATMKNEIHVKSYYKDKRKNILELVSGKY